MRSYRGSPLLTILLVPLLFLSGCAGAHNFEEPGAPRYFGAMAPSPLASSATGLLQLASFNVREGENVRGALEVIRMNPELKRADVLLLQEMDAAGTRSIAEALGMSWIYYPATQRNGRGFGNAVLSRWPIKGDDKIILPHRGLIGDTQRTATVADIDFQGIPLRVYSVHFATLVNQTSGQRTDQITTVLEDAASHPFVVIGGDFNSRSLAENGLDAGFTWPTRDGPRTTWFARVDHILLKGFGASDIQDSGTVEGDSEVSDHRPVWVRARPAATIGPR